MQRYFDEKILLLTVCFFGFKGIKMIRLITANKMVSNIKVVLYPSNFFIAGGLFIICVS